MDSEKRKARGLGLCSGGLDSMLAGLVLREQGIEADEPLHGLPCPDVPAGRRHDAREGI